MFKNENGRYLTKALFFELTLPDSRQHAVFTLKEDDHEVDGVVYRSLKRLFLQYDDPTEYEFAKNELGGYKHWKELCSQKEIAEHIEEWREERDVMLRSRGIRDLMSQEGSFQAAKYLADKGWEQRQAGRPTKAAVERETKQQAAMKVSVLEDYKRLKGE